MIFILVAECGRPLLDILYHGSEMHSFILSISEFICRVTYVVDTLYRVLALAELLEFSPCPKSFAATPKLR